MSETADHAARLLRAYQAQEKRFVERRSDRRHGGGDRICRQRPEWVFYRRRAEPRSCQSDCGLFRVVQ